MNSAPDRPTQIGASSAVFPSLFVSHGAPTLLLEDVPARHFLAECGNTLGRPRALLVISAHDAASSSVVSTAGRHHAVHDFRGFPQALYEIGYTPPGDAGLAHEVASRLRAAGIATQEKIDPGLDHGAWVPLMLMYPAADVPVVSVALDMSLSNDRLMAVGRALGGLRREGVLIVASGSFTHNLREFRPGMLDAAPPDYLVEFADWMTHVLQARDDRALVDWERRAPHAQRTHPTVEHFSPLLVAYGAGETRTDVLHASFTHRVIGMHAFAFY